MAKANITLDTETGKLEVSVNGKKINNVNYVSIGTYHTFDYDTNAMVNKVGFTAEVTDKDVDGVYTYTRITAKQTQDGQAALAKGNPIYTQHDEFVVMSHSSNVEEEALKLLR